MREWKGHEVKRTQGRVDIMGQDENALMLPCRNVSMFRSGALAEGGARMSSTRDRSAAESPVPNEVEAWTIK